MALEHQANSQFMMKDPMFTPPIKKERPRVVPPNLDTIIGMKEYWKEAGVANVIKQLSNGHGKIFCLTIDYF